MLVGIGLIPANEWQSAMGDGPPMEKGLTSIYLVTWTILSCWICSTIRSSGALNSKEKAIEFISNPYNHANVG